MSNSPKHITVFVASPSDVQVERDIIKEVVDNINNSSSAQSGFWLELIRWEDRVHPGIGRPQAVVNQQIGEYEIFMGIMWKRFGSPTGKASSGTEEEFEIAYNLHKETRIPSICFYFCTRAHPTPVDDTQWIKVKAFKQRVSSVAIIQEFETPEELGLLVRNHLDREIHERRSQTDINPTHLSGQATKTIQSTTHTRKFRSISQPEIRLPLSDLDRVTFIQDGFNLIYDYCSQAGQDLSDRYNSIDFRIARDSSDSFVFEIFQNGTCRKACRICISDSFGAGTMALSMGENKDSLRFVGANELAFYKEETVGHPAFSIMGMLDIYLASPDKAVGPEALAEYFWRQATLSLGS